MSDLISRQNAIDTVFSHRYEYENKLLNDYEQGWNDACDYAADEWLESLPYGNKRIFIISQRTHQIAPFRNFTKPHKTSQHL